MFPVPMSSGVVPVVAALLLLLLLLFFRAFLLTAFCRLVYNLSLFGLSTRSSVLVQSVQWQSVQFWLFLKHLQ
jgi:hypothetical protein